MQSTHLTRAPLRGSPPTVYRGDAEYPIPNKKMPENKRKTQQSNNKKNTKLNGNLSPNKKPKARKTLQKNPSTREGGGANTHCL